ncbi:hypothetical protein D9757_002412 [Collybiopsis confluens]|uniref:Uncharacterized protein n=1 Tax=Collybiopsis confluens TaxID=2823264 RepID=A0A8H5MEZ2_9AGAR|nr:hypothetical protein D9757_002412 [Collybiopsis confluens]
MRELSRQLSSQTSPTLLPEELRSAVDEASCDADKNTFLDTPPEAIELSVPTAHMHSVIACIPTLGRRTASRWKDIFRTMLTHRVDGVTNIFPIRVDDFLADAKTTRFLEEICSVIGKFRSLARFLISPVNSSDPRLTASQLEISIETQHLDRVFVPLYLKLSLSLSPPCFLSSGKRWLPALTFEMLNDYVRSAFHVLGVAPVQVNGDNIIMTRCTRPILWTAFEQLLVNCSADFCRFNSTLTKSGQEFSKYRCAVTREDARKSVEKTGNSSLKLFLIYEMSLSHQYHYQHPHSAQTSLPTNSCQGFYDIDALPCALDFMHLVLMIAGSSDKVKTFHVEHGQ